MKLTLSAPLLKLKSDCEEVGALSSILSAEEATRINLECMELSRTVDCALEIVGELSNLKYSLDASGYSEEWFDIASQCRSFSLVQLDMPKFFDNKENRAQACQEGIGETIIEWLKKAWDAIKRFLAWLRDCIHRVFKFMNLSIDQSTSVAAKVSACCDKLSDDWLEKHGIECNNFFDVNLMIEQLGWVAELTEIMCGEDYRNDLDLREQKQDSHAMAIDILKRCLDQRRIPYNDMKKYGFEIKNNNLVFLSRVDAQNLFHSTKIEVLIKSRGELEAVKESIYTKLLEERKTVQVVIQDCDMKTKDWLMICNKAYEDSIKGDEKSRTTVFNTYKLASETVKFMAGALQYLCVVEKMSRELDVLVSRILNQAISDGGAQQ